MGGGGGMHDLHIQGRIQGSFWVSVTPPPHLNIPKMPCLFQNFQVACPPPPYYRMVDL